MNPTPLRRIALAALLPGLTSPAGPRVVRLQFGGPDAVVTNTDSKGRPVVIVHGDEILDLAAAPSGPLWAVGRLQSAEAVPAVIRPVRHGDGPAPYSFAARLRTDLSAIEAVALWPTGVFTAGRCTAMPGSDLVIAGRLGPDGAAQWPTARSEKTRTALLRLAANAGRLLWVVPGAPNQSEIAGLACTPDGRRIFWTGSTLGRGIGAYVVQADASTGKSIPFEGTGEWAIGLHPDSKTLSMPGQVLAF